MFRKTELYWQIFRNMGWRYVQFRFFYALRAKLGILRRQFPIRPPQRSFISLEDWKKLPVHFFFESKESLHFPKTKSQALQDRFTDFQCGKLRFFNAIQFDIGKNYDWLTNPENGYKYDISKHWSQISDLSEEAGDIKFVWEKSRFSYLHDLIRYDYHFEEDLSELVFEEIESWMTANPINQGPNYKCSQEISLRLLNWIFALHYYENAPALNEAIFQKIQHYIYWQLRHVYCNSGFSRYTVRNNHAITECLMLYIGGLFFPFFPEASTWKAKGKKWFEEEITYQIYEDGTFLQFSHNYHRVLIQLLTVGFRIADLNGERFQAVVYEKAAKSLDYLFQCQSGRRGELPNYGANDGALFFKWNDAGYRDFRPQLNALYYFFSGKHLYPSVDGTILEDYWWLGLDKSMAFNPTLELKKKEIAEYKQGGIYIINDRNTFTFIKCAGYRDRPSQADNMHVDIWVNGENILRDAGTYKYNTQPDLVRYFTGTKGHNTVMLGDYDQMLKGPRFVWLYWSKVRSAQIKKNDTAFEFSGVAEMFHHVNKGIIHRRTIKKEKGKSAWVIEDTIEHGSKNNITQHWHYSSSLSDEINFQSTAENRTIEPAFYSGFYGKIEESTCMIFTDSGKKITTTFTVKPAFT